MPNLPMNGARYPAATRDFDGNGTSGAYLPRSNAARMATPTAVSTGQSFGMTPIPSASTGSCNVAPVVSNPPVAGAQDPTETADWRQAGDEMRRLRSRYVIMIERMLRNHQPHDVLTQVPENYDWHSKTFTLAIKIERLMFTTATSRENYLNESTLRARVQLLSRHLVRLRKRKNAMAVSYETRL